MKKSLSLILYIVGGIVFAVPWVSALISRWSRLLFLLILSVIALPIYLFWGPTPEKLASVEASEM